MIKRFFIFNVLLILSYTILSAQTFQGKVIEKESNHPIEYVNIGIPFKNVGTVSNTAGKYLLKVEENYKNDSIVFSCIGYLSKVIKLSNLKENQTVFLEKQTYSIKDFIVRPRATKMKILGVKSKSRKIQAGFKDNTLSLGYECGILMKNKKSSTLQEVTINIANCTLDSIYYRLNIYKKVGKKQFTNILTEPIYIETESIPSGTISIDLVEDNITLKDDFLVTLENINGQQGKMLFCAGVGKKTYYRKTSQAKWETVPVGISFSVKVEMEK